MKKTAHPTFEVEHDPDGEWIKLRPANLPAVVDVRAFTVTLTHTDLEGLYCQSRARQLGFGLGGDL